ncbi:MAG: BCD family MFS transporter [Oscillochloris sp.]|nr:BCD family MFS transporter [Oscillochloris sp.]
MTFLTNIRLGLLHVAVAISLVLIAGVLNRIMIRELGLCASLVAALMVLPYLFLPVPVGIGLAITLLNFGTGIATATNLALMLAMITPEQVWLAMRAWGVANSAACGLSHLLVGMLHDLAGLALVSPSDGYMTVFVLEVLMLGVALVMRRRIDMSAFHDERPSLIQRTAVVGDA